MRRILFNLHGIRIYSYPAMLFMGTSVGITASNYAANLAGLDTLSVYIALVLLTIPALLGSRLLFVATHWKFYRHETSRIWRKSEGGGAMLGGLLLSLAVSIPLLWALKIPLAAFWDVATFSLLIGMMFGRVGCVLNGCCSGRQTEDHIALYLPNHQGEWQRRTPVQFLEAGLAVLLLLGSVGFWSLRPFAGAVFLTVLSLYAIVRFILQPLREAQDWIGPINVQQAFSATIAIIALTSLLVGWLGGS